MLNHERSFHHNDLQLAATVGQSSLPMCLRVPVLTSLCLSEAWVWSSGTNTCIVGGCIQLHGVEDAAVAIHENLKRTWEIQHHETVVHRVLVHIPSIA